MNNTIQHTKETLWKTIIHSPFLQPTCSECFCPQVLFLERPFFVHREFTQGGHVGSELGYRCNVGGKFKVWCMRKRDKK
jgi:hypothetical protein